VRPIVKSAERARIVSLTVTRSTPVAVLSSGTSHGNWIEPIVAGSSVSTSFQVRMLSTEYSSRIRPSVYPCLKSRSV
jgi:hypothetical protein